MPRPGKRDDTDIPAGQDVTIRDLLSYQVARTASLMSKGAALRFKREHGVNLGEWRALALIATGRRQSLAQISRAAALDKAQMSRVISSLIARDLVCREVASQGRMIELTLSRKGRDLYRKLIAAARERNDAFISKLNAQERDILPRILDKLAATARELVQSEARLDDDE